MRRTRVLFVIGTLEIGGAEGQLTMLATRIDRRRYEARVISLAKGGYYVQVLEAAGIAVEVLGLRRQDLRTPHMIGAKLLRLVRYMREYRPDIVHGILFWAYVFGAFAARLSGVPIVISSRRSLGYFKKTKIHYRVLEYFANRGTDLVIANSNAVRLDVLREERLPKQKVLSIHNGVEVSGDSATQSLARKSFDLPADAFIVGVLANLLHYKGHSFFLRAWRDVLGGYPGAIALLIGEGPLRRQLEQEAEALEPSNSVRFLGRRRDVGNLLAAIDVLVHPSLEEGFSNAILEAMAAGRPVIATQVGGTAEAVIDGVTGLLVPAADSHALAAAILKLAEDESERTRLGKAGLVRAREAFDIPQMVRRYEAVYEEAVANYEDTHDSDRGRRPSHRARG